MTAQKALPEAAYVLANAVDNVKRMLSISNDDLANIIGVHRNTLARFLKEKALDPNSKEGELALLLIRVYRALYALNGGNLDAMGHWLRTQNRHLQAVPLEAMKTVMGLSQVVQYLDAIRGKI